MKNTKTFLLLFGLGCIPMIWLALLIAPYAGGSLASLFENAEQILSCPFRIKWCEYTVRTVIVLLLFYAMAIGICYSTKRNYRRGEEHGSAKWGNAGQVNKKYCEKKKTSNKLLTQNVCIGLDGKKHRRNLNTIVCGGSGAGKTRFYCKPNTMQCNTSFVILDPKGENLRDTGSLLEEKGYEVRVLDLINMERLTIKSQV